jgi:hypothetical protein
MDSQSIDPPRSKFDELIALEAVWLNASGAMRTLHPSIRRDSRDDRGDRPGP